MKYEDMKDQYNTDKYGFQFIGKYIMLAKEPKPCSMCGELTKSIDVFSEGYICSEECQHKFDCWCNEVCNNSNDENYNLEYQIYAIKLNEMRSNRKVAVFHSNNNERNIKL